MASRRTPDSPSAPKAKTPAPKTAKPKSASAGAAATTADVTAKAAGTASANDASKPSGGASAGSGPSAVGGATTGGSAAPVGTAAGSSAAQPKRVTKPKAPASAPAKAQVSEDTRRAMIAESAYLRAEKRGFAPGGEHEDWMAAEREVDALLNAKMGAGPQ